MPPKPKLQNQQSDSEHEVQQHAISKIHDKKQLYKEGVCYLVQFKGRSKKSQWEWKTEKELKKCIGFKEELNKFTNNASQKPKDLALEKSIAESASNQKKLQKSSLKKKLQIDNKQMIERLKLVTNQQTSLDTFVKPTPKQKIEQKNIESKPQPTLFATQLQSLAKSPFANKLIQNSQDKEHSQKNSWIDKIKAIKTIKGYEVKNGHLTYDTQVWDKNGQTLFVPPLSSETLRKIDEAKLAVFLHECLIRWYQGQLKPSLNVRI